MENNTRESYLNDSVTLSLPRCVAFLAVAMVEKLKQPVNQAKGHWIGLEYVYLYSRLEEEAAELWGELNSAEIDMTAVVKEAADVANFAMMICTMNQVEPGFSWQVPAEYARKPFDLALTELIGRDAGVLE